MKENILKSCPFCGGKPKIENYYGMISNTPIGCYVECSNCHVTSRTVKVDTDYSAKEEVIKIWNMRMN